MNMQEIEKLRALQIPKEGVQKIASKRSSAVVYLSGVPDRLMALGFVGKAHKPAFHYRFRSAEKRREWVGKWIQGQDARVVSKAQSQAEAKAKKAAGHRLKVGSVLRCSWGYDQTNIDYFEVVSLVGKRMVEIRELCQERESNGLFMQGNCVPLPGEYIEGKEAMRKVVSVAGDSVRIHSFASAYLVEPMMVDGKAVGYKPSSWTAYA